MMQFAKSEMTQKLGTSDPELLDAIIPKNFGVGCRRPTVSATPILLSIELPEADGEQMISRAMASLKHFLKTMSKCSPSR